MKSFHFGLERVLAWRRAQLTRQEALLEELNAARESLIREITAIAASRESAVRGVRQAGAVMGRDLKALDCLVERFDRTRLEIGQRILERERAIETQRAAATEARRRVRLLERLRERRVAAWTIEFEREMEGLAGEFSLAQWRRGPLVGVDRRPTRS